MGWARTVVASTIIGAAGGVLFSSGTDGFRAFTTEQARRLAVEESPRALPPVTLEDQDGIPFVLGDFVGQRVALNFIYTHCVSTCALLSAGFERIFRAGGDVQLVSISFDPRDTPARLKEYGTHFAADGITWRFAAVRDTADISRLLRAFGVVVIPDGRGDFQHNAAVHLLDTGGRLARVLDPDASMDDVARAVARR
jgi:protein SCO1/2